MDANPELFDRHRRRVLRGRAAACYADHAFLKDAMVDDIAARVADTRKSFARVLDLGAHDGRLGARIAGGCTSGHGISGIAQLSVGSTLARNTSC